MPACAIYLIYFGTSFVAGTEVNGPSKIFDNPKTHLNNNCMGVYTNFLKFSGENKTMS